MPTGPHRRRPRPASAPRHSRRRHCCRGRTEHAPAKPTDNAPARRPRPPRRRAASSDSRRAAQPRSPVGLPRPFRPAIEVHCAWDCRSPCDQALSSFRFEANHRDHALSCKCGRIRERVCLQIALSAHFLRRREEERCIGLGVHDASDAADDANLHPDRAWARKRPSPPALLRIGMVRA